MANTQHSFNVEHAAQYGVNEAIVIGYLSYCCFINRANGRNVHQGRAWTWNTVEALKEIFPYWKPSKIRRILDSLVAQHVIIKGNHSKNAYDRTIWYAFREESLFFGKSAHLPKMTNAFAESDKCISQKRQMDLPDLANGFVESDKCSIYTIKDTIKEGGATVEKEQKGKAKKKATFTAPTVEEIRAYAKEKNLDDYSIDFWEYYENLDWRLSGGRGAKMKSWVLAYNRWCRNQSSFSPKKTRLDNAREGARRSDFLTHKQEYITEEDYYNNQRGKK